MKNRISEDLSIHFRTMSFACACLIVVLHACARPMFGTWNWVVAYCIGSGICQVAVPFFFLASGYFLAGRLCEEGWYGRSVRSRIHTLLVPFFSWRLICVVFGLCIAYGINAIGYSNYRGNIVIPDYSLNWWLNLPGLNPFENVGAIWYLRALFILVVASPCLVTFLRKIGAWTIISLFALYLLSVCMLEPNTRAWNFFEYFLSLRGLVYFCVGIYLRECEIRFVRGSGGLLLLSGWGLLVLKTYLASWGFSRGEAVVGCLMVPGLMFSVWWLTQHVKWPLSLTTMAFPLYLIHQMVLLVIAIGFAILGLSAYARTSLFGMGVKVFLAIAMSLTISIVVRRFNISKFLLLGGRG